MLLLNKRSFTRFLASLMLLGTVSLQGQIWNGLGSDFTHAPVSLPTGPTTDVTNPANWITTQTPAFAVSPTVPSIFDTADSIVFTGGNFSGNAMTLPSVPFAPGSFSPGAIAFALHAPGTFTVGDGGAGNAAVNVGYGGIGASTLGSLTIQTVLPVTPQTNSITDLGVAANIGTVIYNMTGGYAANTNSLTFSGGGQVGNGLAQVNLTNGFNTFTVNTAPAIIDTLTSTLANDSIVLTTGLTVGNNGGTQTVVGAISGPSGLSKVGTNILALSGTNTFVGPLTISGGGTVKTTGALAPIPAAVAVTFNNNSILELAQTSNVTLSGLISGPGGLLVDGGETVTLTNGANNYSGGTTVTGATSIVSIASDANLGSDLGGLTLSNGGTLLTTASTTLARPVQLGGTGGVINTGAFNDVISGPITGPNTAPLTKQGVGSLTLTGLANTYSGGTIIAATGGTLVGGSQNFPVGGPISVLSSGVNVGTLNFSQQQNGSFTGVLSGSGDITTAGSTAELTLTADSSGFTGTTNVPAGNLAMAAGAKLGGVVNVTGGTLSGFGTLNIVNVFSGKIHPGGSPGILPMATFNQSGGIFGVSIAGFGNTPGVNNSELAVAGAATLTNDPSVVVTSDTGSYSIGGAYTILTSSALTGTFNPAVSTINALTGLPLNVTPILVYAGNDVLLDFQTPFLLLAANQNQLNVATALASITSPTPDELILLDDLTALTVPEIELALEQMSGEQYAQLGFTAELSNRQFIRRLYDPLRCFLATNPCCQQDYCCGNDIEVWAEASGLHSRLNNTSTARSYNKNGWEVGAGIQYNLDQCWIVGVAGTYEHGNIDYRLGGKNNVNTGLGAIYGAYRNEMFYVLGDIVLGGSSYKLNRSFFVGPVEYSESGKPTSFQGALYVEAGMSFMHQNITVQPFIGFEGGYYNHHKFDESGSDPVALSFNKRSYGTAYSRLGVHFLSQVTCGLTVAADLAWDCRLNARQDHRTAFFDFGSTFEVQGATIDRNSFDVSVNLSQQLCDGWGLFVTGNGQFWNKASAYDIVGGIFMDW